MSLTKIGFFNPGRLTDEEIEQSFITRIPFFEMLFKKVITEKANSIPQQYLIIGQRGMGKTSLLVRIAAELRKEPYRNSFIPLSFPEEQYNVDRLSKFWLNCLDALADALDKENNKGELIDLDAEINHLSKQTNLDANAVYETLKKWTLKIKRRPVLLVDNLNLIFSKINKEEQHELRAILMSNGAPILIGASATSIEETVDYGAPFYDAFQISYLKKLSFQESLDVLINLARLTGNANFENKVYEQKGRLEALYQLTGGTPRTLAILFPLIQGGFSENIQTDLDALLDIITPLYKARFEELAPQLQVVMDAVALHWDPINLEQLRIITQLENAQLSPQLKRLVDVGWLQKLDAYKAKGGAYELSERFFNIWYLMRRSSRRQKRELYCLTKFLETFYGNDLHEIAKMRLTCKSESTNHIAFDLALADAINGSEMSDTLRNKSYDDLFERGLNNNVSVLEDFNIPSHVKEKKLRDLSNEANDFFKKRDFENVEQNLKKILLIDNQNEDAWYNLGVVYSNHLKKYEEATNAYKKAIEFNSKDEQAWNNLGNLYKDYFQDYIKAEDAYNKAISINDKFIYPLTGLAKLYVYEFKKYDEAENIYKKIIEIDDRDIVTYVDLGNLYQLHLHNYTKAESEYKKAINIDPNYSYGWFGLGVLYSSKLRKYNEAENAYKKAIEIDSQWADPWFGLGNLYQDFFEKYEDAETAYKKALSLQEDYFFVWNQLGNLYQDFLGKYKEAEKAYQKAINFYPSDMSAKYNLVFLWRDKMGKVSDAKNLFDSIIISNGLRDCHYLNEALFAFYDKNIGIAEEILKKALIEIEGNLPTNTTEDWYRSAAVIIKLGFGNNLLNVLSANGYDIIFKPFYIAIEALTKKEDELYFNSISAEVREPAKKIVELIKNYIKK